MGELARYAVPEGLVLPVDVGVRAYRQWIHDSVPVEGR